MKILDTLGPVRKGPMYHVIQMANGDIQQRHRLMQYIDMVLLIYHTQKIIKTINRTDFQPYFLEM